MFETDYLLKLNIVVQFVVNPVLKYIILKKVQREGQMIKKI